METNWKQLGTRLKATPLLRDQAYDILKDAILSGEFMPGQRLVETEISTSLGLSRSPVREAFRRLEQEGYLEVSRGGIFVKKISPQDIYNLFAVRQKLEGLAASLAAELATEAEVLHLRTVLQDMAGAVEKDDQEAVKRTSYEFHRALYSLAGNGYLADILNKLAEELRYFRSLNVTIPHRGREALKEHQLIVEAIVRHDSQAADHLAQEHVKQSLDHTRVFIKRLSNRSIRDSESDAGI